MQPVTQWSATLGWQLWVFIHSLIGRPPSPLRGALGQRGNSAVDFWREVGSPS
jgi:hypothetical protein